MRIFPTRKAITLIELLMTTLIIAILSVVIFISVSGSLEQARLTQLQQQQNLLNVALQSATMRALQAMLTSQSGALEVDEPWYASLPEEKPAEGSSDAVHIKQDQKTRGQDSGGKDQGYDAGKFMPFFAQELTKLNFPGFATVLIVPRENNAPFQMVTVYGGTTAFPQLSLLLDLTEIDTSDRDGPSEPYEATAMQGIPLGVKLARGTLMSDPFWEGLSMIHAIATDTVGRQPLQVPALGELFDPSQRFLIRISESNGAIAFNAVSGQETGSMLDTLLETAHERWGPMADAYIRTAFSAAGLDIPGPGEDYKLPRDLDFQQLVQGVGSFVGQNDRVDVHFDPETETIVFNGVTVEHLPIFLGYVDKNQDGKVDPSELALRKVDASELAGAPAGATGMAIQSYSNQTIYKDLTYTSEDGHTTREIVDFNLQQNGEPDRSERYSLKETRDSSGNLISRSEYSEVSGGGLIDRYERMATDNGLRTTVTYTLTDQGQEGGRFEEYQKVTSVVNLSTGETTTSTETTLGNPLYQPGGPYYNPQEYGYPQGGSYPPPQGGYYPPPQGGYYPPPQGGYYPPPQGGYYPPPEGGYYPPPEGGGSVPPPEGGYYPQ